MEITEEIDRMFPSVKSEHISALYVMSGAIFSICNALVTLEHKINASCHLMTSWAELIDFSIILLI